MKKIFYLFIGIVIIFTISFFYYKIFISKKVYTFNNVKKVEVNITGYVKKEGLYQVDYNTTYYNACNSYNLLYDNSVIFDYDQKITSNVTIDVKKRNDNAININAATLDELITLKGIQEKTANKILDYIKTNNKIDSWDTFKKITSIQSKYLYEVMLNAYL